MGGHMMGQGVPLSSVPWSYAVSGAVAWRCMPAHYLAGCYRLGPGCGQTIHPPPAAGAAFVIGD
jgi:hypothetical protein